jgi:hypothetical protein
MKLILITGLDGSGKSGLLQRLEDHITTDKTFCLRVPKIDAQSFVHDTRLFGCCNLINKMHTDADRLKHPALKVISLFSSMLIFPKMLKSKEMSEVIFCERHPLVDTSVYARFYSDKMKVDDATGKIFKVYEVEFENEIRYLQNLFHDLKPDGKLITYLKFINDWFSRNPKPTIHSLRELFQVQLPDKIIYLWASPETLMNRLSTRKVLEPHESLPVLTALLPVYDEVLAETGIEVEKINTADFDNVDRKFEELLVNYF